MFSSFSHASVHVTDIDECAPNGGLGPCAQICDNTQGSFVCSCEEAYTLLGYACNGEKKLSKTLNLHSGMSSL